MKLHLLKQRFVANNFLSKKQIAIIKQDLNKGDEYIFAQMNFLAAIKNPLKYSEVITELHDQPSKRNLHAITLSYGLRLARFSNNMLLVTAFFQDNYIERLISKESDGEINDTLIWICQQGYLSILKLLCKNSDFIRDTENNIFKEAFFQALIHNKFEIIDYFFSSPQLLLKIKNYISIIESYLEELFTNLTEDSYKNAILVLKNKYLSPYLSKQHIINIVNFAINNQKFDFFYNDSYKILLGRIFIQSIKNNNIERLQNFIKAKNFIPKKYISNSLFIALRNGRLILTSKIIRSFILS